MKKKILVISISIVILAIIGGSLFYINSKNRQMAVDDVITLIKKNDLKGATSKINKSHFNDEEQKKINTEILTILTKYKVNSYDDFNSLTNEDWNNIKEFSILIRDLKLQDKNSKFKYIDELLKLEDYRKYLPSINWQNSNDYTIWQEYLKIVSQNNISWATSMLSKYSFEKYGIENECIKTLNEEKNKLVNYLTIIGEALNESNMNKYNGAYSSMIDTLTTLSNTEIEILTKSTELNNEIKKLPAI